ncbi:DUF1275 domain-containing protein [Rhodococcus sp. 1R11]|uniref:YoaK family protein n=1 Tax=Rhodococcus sp. 1R11 TaxID=2559614 RepID=UPI001072C64B|nr:YoaK family protein [Rhodococcus sp. 1R11]TFI42473.1 DUF1275 domain-containing protein [Rhodococcus sp. 1R11]
MSPLERNPDDRATFGSKFLALTRRIDLSTSAGPSEKRLERRRVLLMLVLTFVTGVLDAVGYLGLDKVFTGNMTGNVVILAMGLGGGDELPVLGPLVALLLFSLGAVVAGMALKKHPGKWNRTITLLLAAGTFVLVGAAVATFIIGPDLPHAAGIVVAAVIALQMGVQACIARKLAVRDMTTVVVTSTLTSLAGEDFVRGGKTAVFNRRAGAIVVIFLGAVVGTLLLHFVHMSAAISLSALLTGSVTVIGHRSWNPRSTEPSAFDASRVGRKVTR